MNIPNYSNNSKQAFGNAVVLETNISIVNTLNNDVSKKLYRNDYLFKRTTDGFHRTLLSNGAEKKALDALSKLNRTFSPAANTYVKLTKELESYAQVVRVGTLAEIAKIPGFEAILKHIK